MGMRGDVYRPAMLPGYGFGPGGNPNGPEFGSIPSPGDPHQSPGSVAGPHFIPPQVHSPTAPNNAAAVPHPSSTPPAAAGAALNSGASFNDPTAAPAGGNLIPLGNGLHYDPVTDTVVGGGYGNSSTSG